MGINMPVNPHTKLYNITEGEFLDAVAATEDVPLTREDGTLTRAGQVYVADMRRAMCSHDDIRDTGTFDADGGHISECADCGDTWNGGTE